MVLERATGKISLPSVKFQCNYNYFQMDYTPFSHHPIKFKNSDLKRFIGG